MLKVSAPTKQHFLGLTCQVKIISTLIFYLGDINIRKSELRRTYEHWSVHKIRWDVADLCVYSSCQLLIHNHLQCENEIKVYGSCYFSKTFLNKNVDWFLIDTDCVVDDVHIGSHPRVVFVNISISFEIKMSYVVNAMI